MFDTSFQKSVFAELTELALKPKTGSKSDSGNHSALW